MSTNAHHLTATLAQTQTPPSEVASNLWFWVFIAMLIVATSLGGLVIFWVRRWARGHVPVNRPGFTLEDLRAMLDRGEVTQREYDTARDTMLNKARQAARKERERRGGTDWSGPEGGSPQRKPGR